MTQEIIEMAREAGFDMSPISSAVPKLKRFAILVASKEREACARVCEQSAQNYYPVIPEASGACTHLATAIRARGQA